MFGWYPRSQLVVHTASMLSGLWYRFLNRVSFCVISEVSILTLSVVMTCEFVHRQLTMGSERIFSLGSTRTVSSKYIHSRGLRQPDKCWPIFTHKASVNPNSPVFIFPLKRLASIWRVPPADFHSKCLDQPELLRPSIFTQKSCVNTCSAIWLFSLKRFRQLKLSRLSTLALKIT